MVAQAPVSILVLVDVGPRRSSPSCAAKSAIWFQSLFSWMSVLGSGDVPGRGHPYEVSILVLVDVGPRLRGFYQGGLPPGPEFQSLFSWMSVLGRGSARARPATSRSFNPCSR